MPAKGMLIALLLLQIVFSTANITTEGGNVTAMNISQPVQTAYWAGIAGWMDNSTSPDLNYPVYVHFTNNASISPGYPNGSVSNYSMLVTRLPSKPPLPSLSSPIASDFNSSGMFSNFSLFLGEDFTAFLDSPLNTFANPYASLPCRVGDTTFSCAYIYLEQDSFLGILKYTNGTHTEPVFLAYLNPTQGYNGSTFDFQYILPVNETYFFYIYPEQPINVAIFSPNSTEYSVSALSLNYSASPLSVVDSCWYVLDGGTSTPLPNCTAAQLTGLSDGSHTLTVYANASDGQVGSASVTFTVKTAPEDADSGTDIEEEEEEPPEGELPPEEVPLPAKFILSPKSACIEVEYLSPGGVEFALFSSVPLSGVECFVDAEFAEYVSVSLESDRIAANSTIRGELAVDMPLQAIMEHSGREGRSSADLFYCTASRMDFPLMVRSNPSSLVLNAVPPSARAGVENETDINVFEDHILLDLLVENTGNSSLRNLSLVAYGPKDFRIIFPERIGALSPGNSMVVPAHLFFPENLTLPDVFPITFELFENGLSINKYTLDLEISGKEPAPTILPDFYVQTCSFPAFFPLYEFVGLRASWIFIALLFLATWCFLQWMRVFSPAMSVLVSMAPFLLSLPGEWMFEPCTMMNLALVEFAFFLLWDAARGPHKKLFGSRHKKKN